MSVYIIDKDGEKAWNNTIFNIIKIYGGATCERQVKGYLSTSIAKSTFLPDDLQTIIQKLLPNEEAAEVKRRAATQIYNPGDVTKTTFFGYSASDITKIMNSAIQNAAAKALKGYFELNESLSTDTDQYYISSINGALKINDIPQKSIGNILNFTICLEHIVKAIAKYPPTVSAKEYIRVLNYSHHGSPE